MVGRSSLAVQSALEFMTTGRFSDAVALLQPKEIGRHADRSDLLANAVLADALQRTGYNQRALEIAIHNLPLVKQSPHLIARYHFVLGNIHRDRSYPAKAIEHFQIAISNSASNLELTCWSHLRLILVIAELSGFDTALTRVDDVKRALARWGDARAFAALHLWLVEAESTRGNLDNARRHLSIAESLLSNVDDIWLRGYAAVNSSALYYYSGNTSEAKSCANDAIHLAQQSGHRPTLLAAYTNLGHIECALGGLSEAERCFGIALRCCESGSVNEIAILDSAAQLKLQLNDLKGCRTLVSRLEHLIRHNEYAKRRHYNACALLTKTRLLLREGHQAEALQATCEVRRLIGESSSARMPTDALILCVDTLLANGDSSGAADNLKCALTPGTHLSPDLFARLEQATARTLASAKAFDRARDHFERAVHTFAAIGHVSGMQHSHEELKSLPVKSISGNDIASQRSLDRFRALLDLRGRPELLGLEALLLLEELECTEAIELSVYADGKRSLIRRVGVNDAVFSNSATSVSLNVSSHRPVTLAYLPKRDENSRLIAATFHKVLKQVVEIVPVDAISSDNDIAWNADGGSLTKDGAVFACDSMLAVLKAVKQIAPTDVSVFVKGETGTGKEVIARAIHDHSLRSSMPFLAFNCAAVPKDLLESQLFGHRKGAFSGATENYVGIARAANGGTLFLDEIGEIPLEIQVKLLRFLEMSEVHPVGEAFPVKVNVRLIFATNSDLEQAIVQNRFRRDLFYRLNVVPIKIPPLRDRKEEIPILANVFAQRFASELSKKPIQFSMASTERLILYSWPGNVRELSNEIRRLAVVKESGAFIVPHDLSPTLQPTKRDERCDDSQTNPHVKIGMDQSLEAATDRLETEMIEHALRQARGNVSAAAAMLHISRKGLYLKRLRLGLVRFRENATTSEGLAFRNQGVRKIRAADQT